METEYKYIYFEKIEKIKDLPKTSVWECKNNRSNEIIGIVKWNSQWRQYCFFPDSYTIFNSTCLQDIIHFINQLSEDRQISKNRKNNHGKSNRKTKERT
jgi:hypothetical protein